jgi:hypothetical protein
MNILKRYIRPKHVADNLNKMVNNYWNRVALDGTPWTWCSVIAGYYPGLRFKGQCKVNLTKRASNAVTLHICRPIREVLVSNLGRNKKYLDWSLSGFHQTLQGSHDYSYWNHLCRLVVRVPGYRSTGPRSIPGAIRLSVKYRVWDGIHSASWVQLRSYLKEKVAALV